MLLFLTTNMAAGTSRANQQSLIEMRQRLWALRRRKHVSINFDQIQVKQIVLKDSEG